MQHCFDDLPADLVADSGDALLGLVESRLAAVWSNLLLRLCESLSVSVLTMGGSEVKHTVGKVLASRIHCEAVV